MAKASSPAKVILLGEHAAVYGKPVLTVTLDLRAYATVKRRDDDKVIINAPDLKVKGYETTVFELPDKIEEKKVGFLLNIVWRALDKIGKNSGLEVTIKSDIPVGSGLGSSAAISSSLILAISEEFGAKLSKQEVAETAWACEHLVHSKSSGVDPFAVTFGGLCSYKHGRIREIKAKKFPELIIVNTGIASKTGDVVSAVNRRKENALFIFDDILKLVAKIVDRGEKEISYGNWRKFGLLMNMNHGLLSSIGVSCVELETLVHAARDAGAMGAKLCGAGCGGIMIALVDEKSRPKVEKALKKHGKIVDAKVSLEGARIE